MKRLFFLIFLFNCAYGQIKIGFPVSLNFGNIPSPDQLLLTTYKSNLFIGGVYDYYKNETVANIDGSISMHLNMHTTTDSLQTLRVFQVDETGKASALDSLKFNPKFSIKYFSKPTSHGFLIYSAENYLFGKQESFLDELNKGRYKLVANLNGFSPVAIAEEHKNLIIIGNKYSNKKTLVFIRLNENGEKYDSAEINYLSLPGDYLSCFTKKEIYIASNGCVAYDSILCPSFSFHLFSIDKKSKLKNDLLLDDSVIHFEPRNIDAKGQHVILEGLVYHKDNLFDKNKKRQLRCITNNSVKWSYEIPEGYNIISLKFINKTNIVAFAEVFDKQWSQIKSYHLIHLDKTGKFRSDIELRWLKTERLNGKIVFLNNEHIFLYGKNIFNNPTFARITL